VQLKNSWTCRSIFGLAFHAAHYRRAQLVDAARCRLAGTVAIQSPGIGYDLRMPALSANVPKRDSIDPPSQWVQRYAGAVVAGGRVLDVACGAGRHARFFAGLGHPVDAVDLDLGAMIGLPPGIHVFEADLENGPWPFAGSRFAAVVVTNYLHRPLVPALLAAVMPGGMLLYETFAVGNERYGRPIRPAFLLNPGELLDWTRADFEVVAYENDYLALPRPAMVQRIAARRRPAPVGDA
jgi:SAM-dependent methyltransferase